MRRLTVDMLQLRQMVVVILVIQKKIPVSLLSHSHCGIERTHNNTTAKESP